MKYAITENGSIIRVSGRPNWYHDDGTLLSESDLLVEGVLPVVDDPPPLNPFQYIVSRKDTSEWVIESDQVLITYDVEERDFGDIINRIKRHLRRVRRQHEEGGVTFNGMPVPTGREDRSIMDGALLMLQNGPEGRTVEWKLQDNSYITLDAQSLNAINEAVWEHVEACFAREKELLEEINEAETPEEAIEIDINSGWPTYD